MSNGMGMKGMIRMTGPGSDDDIEYFEESKVPRVA